MYFGVVFDFRKALTEPCQLFKTLPLNIHLHFRLLTSIHIHRCSLELTELSSKTRIDGNMLATKKNRSIKWTLTQSL